MTMPNFVYIYSFLINGKVKPLFLNNSLSNSTWYQEPNLLGCIFFLFFLLNGFWCIPLFHQRSYHHPKLPRSSTSLPYNQSLQYHQIVIHQLSHMEPSNLISSWRLWSSSLHWWHSYSTITITGVASPNPAYTICKRQDHLIFSALLGDISISLQPLIAHTTTFLDAWQTLANTYDKPSRGHIKQLKEQLKRCTKGSKSINEYMQAIKTCANELALLGKPVDDEDLIDRVLKGLSDE